VQNKILAILKTLFIVLSIGVLLISNSALFMLAFAVIYILLIVRTIMTPGRRNMRRYLVSAYTCILILQVYMIETVLQSGTELGVPEFIFRRVLGLVIMCLPILVGKFVASVKYTHYYLSPTDETVGIGISELLNNAALEIKHKAEIIGESKKKLCFKNVSAFAMDLTRHNPFRYVNQSSLPDEYFTNARNSFSDPNIYIIISKTGSPPSEILSVFTQKQYNHASLSFDKKLQTTISYNGGEKVFSPGLNMELLEFFRKSPDAKLMVYSLPCTAEQKEKMLMRIEKINREGSAYNILGFSVRNRKKKPNILYCTQFVYSMLDDAGLTYFSDNGKIKPTDLVELDYYRKLKFELEITFG